MIPILCANYCRNTITQTTVFRKLDLICILQSDSKETIFHDPICLASLSQIYLIPDMITSPLNWLCFRMAPLPYHQYDNTRQYNDTLTHQNLESKYKQAKVHEPNVVAV